MKAVVLEKTGGPGILRVRDVPTPKITNSNEVLVKLEYAGINFADILSRRGMYSWAPQRPYILGLEGSGRVVETGESVSTIVPDTPVIVATRSGTYAQYIKVTEREIFPVAPGYSMQENAAFAASYMTAMIALREMARVRANETILIHAAAGALGIAASQLSKAMGLKVCGTASKERKLKFLKETLELDCVVNYSQQDFVNEVKAWTQGHGVNHVLESVGGDVFKKSKLVLAPMGRIIVVGATSIKYKKTNPLSLYRAFKGIPRVDILKMIRQSYGVLAFHLGWLFTHSKESLQPTIQELFDLIKTHDIHPVIDSIFSLKDVAKAHEKIERRETIGKVLLQTTP